MQHLFHRQLTVRTTNHILLTVWTSNYINTPSVNPMYFKNQDIGLPTLTIPATIIDHLAASQPTSTISATNIDHLAVSLPTMTISAIDITHPADYNNFISLVNSLNKLSFLLYCYLAFGSFIVLLVVITHMLKFKEICGVDMLISSATSLYWKIYIIIF